MIRLHVLALAVSGALALAPTAFAQDTSATPQDPAAAPLQDPATTPTDPAIAPMQDPAADPAVVPAQDPMAAPAAEPVAQDTATTSSSGSQSGKRFAVVGSYSHAEPKSGSGTLAGAQSSIDGDGAATLSLSYFINDNWAVELWGAADKFQHQASLNGTDVATFSHQPLALSGQYHYTINDTFRPFAGLGYHKTNVDNERAIGPLAGNRLGVETGEGPMATVGMDFLMGETWFARADARYLRWRSDVAVNGTEVGEVKVDPWVLGVGIGARF